MSKNLKFIFTLSILLNVMLLGLIGGHAYKKWADAPWRQGGITEKLSPEGRMAVENLMKASIPQKEDNYQTMGDMRREMGELLRSDPFDPEAFDALTSRMVTIKTRMTRDRMGTTKEIALSLNPQDRKIFSESFMHMREKHWDEPPGRSHQHEPAQAMTTEPNATGSLSSDEPRKGHAEPPPPPELPEDMPPMPGAP